MREREGGREGGEREREGGGRRERGGREREREEGECVGVKGERERKVEHEKQEW